MSAPADISNLRTRLVLEAADDAVDDAGALQRVWLPVTSVWGGLRPRKIDGEYSAGQQQALRGWDIEIRWRPNVAAPMRFRMGQRAFHIRVALDPDARRRRLICRCDEAPV